MPFMTIHHCFYCSILVSRTLSVNEVFPADSPFLGDQNDLNITNLEFRNSVFNVGVGQCSLVNNNAHFLAMILNNNYLGLYILI